MYYSQLEAGSNRRNQTTGMFTDQLYDIKPEISLVIGWLPSVSVYHTARFVKLFLICQTVAHIDSGGRHPPILFVLHKGTDMPFANRYQTLSAATFEER